MNTRPHIKPAKPFPTFPLTAHPNGQWCKKILGKLHFFGVWADPEAAHRHYLRVAEDLHAGREPFHAGTDGLTVKGLGNRFLGYQMERVEAGQIGGRWFEDCRRVIRQFAHFVGTARPIESLNANDFLRYRRRLSTHGIRGSGGLGVHATTRAIVVVQGMFKWAIATGVIETLPRYGQAFAKPTAVEVRRSRASRERVSGKRLFASEQIHAMLEAAAPPLKAAILLGINGGFGNTDCAALPVAAIDLKERMITFERPKTAVQRVVPLWAETEAALRTVIAETDAASARDGLVFHTELGHPLVRQAIHREEERIKKVTYIDRLGDWFDALLKQLKLKKTGLGFYTLRHTFRTLADEACDQHAIHRIMGHSLPGMSGIYIEQISIERLRRVVEHVRGKLGFAQVEAAAIAR